MVHGTRRTYRHGCQCTPCRAAEATYRAAIRQQHRAGRPPLGSLISATDARKLIARLKAEHFTERQIARDACGERHRNPILQRPQRVTLRRYLMLRRYARLQLSAGGLQIGCKGHTDD